MEKFTHTTSAFWRGYRAYVFGGRETIDSGKRTVPTDTSVEPFDNMTDRDKREWREGVEYARKERKECRAIWPKIGNVGHKKCGLHSDLRVKLINILKKNPNKLQSDIARELGVAESTVRKYRIEMGYTVARPNVKRILTA